VCGPAMANPGPNGISVYHTQVFSTHYTKHQYQICISVAEVLASHALNFHGREERKWRILAH
jgi:hypothetical protein